MDMHKGNAYLFSVIIFSFYKWQTYAVISKGSNSADQVSLVRNTKIDSCSMVIEFITR